MSAGLFEGEKRKRAGNEADLDITPMIDVTFLLLIFFMVTSTMKPEPPVDIPPAKHGKGTDTTKAAIITIIMKDNVPKIVCDDGDGPEATLDDVAQYVKTELDTGKSSLLIKADRDTPNGLMMEVARQAANENEGLRYFFAVRDKDK